MSTHHGILLHVVFSTKYRNKVLRDDWRDDLFAYIGGTVRGHEATLIKAGGIEDHVHLLRRTHPKVEYLQMLKLHQIEFDERYVFEQEIVA